MASIDRALGHLLNAAAARHDWLGDPLELWAGASAPAFALLVAALLAWGAWRRGPALRAGLLAGAAAAVSVGLAAAVSRLIDRPRPFAAHPGQFRALVGHAADPGFPSDHATAAFAIAVAVLTVHRRLGLAALAGAALLAVARVAIGVHYPADVLAGALLGGTVAWGLHRLTAGWTLSGAGWATARPRRARPSR